MPMMVQTKNRIHVIQGRKYIKPRQAKTPKMGMTGMSGMRNGRGWFGSGVTQHHDTDTDQYKREEGADVRHISGLADRDQRRHDGYRDAGHVGRMVRCPEGRMNAREPGAEKPISGHGKKYAYLSQHHDDQHARDAGHRARRHNRSTPLKSRHPQTFGHRCVNIDFRIGHQAGQNRSYCDIENCANSQRGEDPDW